MKVIDFVSFRGEPKNDNDLGELLGVCELWEDNGNQFFIAKWYPNNVAVGTDMTDWIAIKAGNSDVIEKYRKIAFEEVSNEKVQECKENLLVSQD